MEKGRRGKTTSRKWGDLKFTKSPRAIESKENCLAWLKICSLPTLVPMYWVSILHGVCLLPFQSAG